MNDPVRAIDLKNDDPQGRLSTTHILHKFDMNRTHNPTLHPLGILDKSGLAAKDQLSRIPWGSINAAAAASTRSGDPAWGTPRGMVRRIRDHGSAIPKSMVRRSPKHGSAIPKAWFGQSENLQNPYKKRPKKHFQTFNFAPCAILHVSTMRC